jgi:hypothetical protein
MGMRYDFVENTQIFYPVGIRTSVVIPQRVQATTIIIL